MKKTIYQVATLLFALICSFAVQAQDRPSWASVSEPEITSISLNASNPRKIVVEFTMLTSTDGADKGRVEMIGANGSIVESKVVGKTRKAEKKVEFEPSKTGTYSFKVYAIRNSEEKEIVSKEISFDFTLPLGKPEVSILNMGKGSLQLTWNSIPEASSYYISYTNNKTGKMEKTNLIQNTSFTLNSLDIDTLYGISVTAIRGEGSPSNIHISTSPVINKLVKAEKERIWNFTYFGQSIKKDYNTFQMLDANDLKFKLNSCSFDSKSQQIIEKGGKFTAFHDGVSFYYTVIDPVKENFELTATFTIDYINISADGQEGFGILAMDSLGEYGVSASNHYTNSAGIIATKFEETINGTKKTSKDTVGSRFVSGITPEVLAMGDAGIAENANSVSKAYSYDQSDLVKAGDVYRLTLKKTNTGYHAIYAKEIESEDTITEFIMYDGSKLLQLDPEHVYVGFAVARGCNVTVSDVVMKITDPATDAPAMEEPPELIPLVSKVDSPTTYTEKKYPFVFSANADGFLTVTDKNNKVLINKKEVKANTDFTKTLSIEKGINDFTVTFDPVSDFAPGPKQAIASWNTELKKYEQGGKRVSIVHSVIYNSYESKSLYVTPEGSALGKGTKENPLDIATAINYANPGQEIILEGGTYYISRGLTIERGNNGTKKGFFKKQKNKVLRSVEGQRAVLDFSGSTLGMQIWGNYWTVKDIDICNTVGNIKGLQVAGNYNTIINVHTYNCGDTGLQISGVSTEPYEKWPKYNSILNCTSWGNCDPAQNNADGFAAKLTCGEGNLFRGCIAYSNIDDGWDLFAKIESGPIGAVTIENCIAYKNGSLPDGSGNGDGNGFKLGGDGIAVPHVLRNSISFNNGTSGITSNSDPAIIIENVLSFGNQGPNINLYGKGTGERLFKASNCMSFDGGGADVIKEMPELASPNNYFWTGAVAQNSEGKIIEESIFVSKDMKNFIPERNADGSINMKGLFELTSEAKILLEGIGPRF